jgi:hypothetical protein
MGIYVSDFYLPMLQNGCNRLFILAVAPFGVASEQSEV